MYNSISNISNTYPYIQYVLFAGGAQPNKQISRELSLAVAEACFSQPCQGVGVFFNCFQPLVFRIVWSSFGSSNGRRMVHRWYADGTRLASGKQKVLERFLDTPSGYALIFAGPMTYNLANPALIVASACTISEDTSRALGPRSTWSSGK